MSVQFYNVKQNEIKDIKKKSFISKMSGYSSIMNTNAGTPDENLEILRISLKKETDRRDKLQRLLEKYQQIQIQQKNHIKSIKAAIIELKDLENHTKTRFFVDPTIYVDNHLSKQTRQFFCMLLNTFYNKYEVNSQCQQKTKELGTQINEMLQKISKNQEMLLRIQKEIIGQQVHLQGELLGQKNRLKDQIQRMKQLQEQNKRIADICLGYENRYNIQLQKVTKLRSFAKNIEKNIQQLKQQVNEGQLLKQGKQQMMAGEINYQQKFQNQLEQLDSNINQQKRRFDMLKQKIKEKRLRIQKMKSSQISIDKVYHQTNVKIAQIKKGTYAK